MLAVCVNKREKNFAKIFAFHHVVRNLNITVIQTQSKLCELLGGRWIQNTSCLLINLKIDGSATLYNLH